MLVKNPMSVQYPIPYSYSNQGSLDVSRLPGSFVRNTGTWLSTATLQTIQPTGQGFQWSAVADG